MNDNVSLNGPLVLSQQDCQEVSEQANEPHLSCHSSEEKHSSKDQVNDSTM